MTRRLPILALSVLLAGCSSIRQAREIGLDTSLLDLWNTSTQAVDAASPSDLVAAGDFVRPAIAVGQDGKIAIAAEGPKMASVHVWTWSGRKWDGAQIATASAETAGRCYVPDVAVDDAGVVYVSFRWGNKERGKLHGPGLVVAGKPSYPGLTTGAARLALTSDGVVLMSKDGAWGLLDRSGAVVRSGRFSAGSTGEKFDFSVSLDGRTWATAHNGYSAQSAALAIGVPSAARRVTWADYLRFPEQGDDLCYPSVCLGSNGSAWAASVFGGRLRVNACDAGGRLRWPADALPDLGPAAASERCPPRLVAWRGAVWAVYEQGGQVWRLDVAAGAERKAKPIRIAAGRQPAAAVDHAGRLHVAYIVSGAVKYGIIEE